LRGRAFPALSASPLTPISADVANAPGLPAINAASTMYARHLGRRGLQPFTNLTGITDMINAMRVPQNEDAALVVACRPRLEGGRAHCVERDRSRDASGGRGLPEALNDAQLSQQKGDMRRTSRHPLPLRTSIRSHGLAPHGPMRGSSAFAPPGADALEWEEIGRMVNDRSEVRRASRVG
jgi:hypothetical protein